MVTRLYVSNAAPDYDPATLRGTWTITSVTLSRKLGPKAGAAATSGVDTAATGNSQGFLGKWISGPFSAGGTVPAGMTMGWIVGAMESVSTPTFVHKLHVYVTVGDTDVVRTTLVANTTGGAVWTTTANGRGASGNAVTSGGAVQSGDRIVVEIGFSDSATVSAGTGTINYGNTGATDLLSGVNTPTTNPGWIEFSAGMDQFFAASSQRFLAFF